jgi:protein BCP1
MEKKEAKNLIEIVAQEEEEDEGDEGDEGEESGEDDEEDISFEPQSKKPKSGKDEKKKDKGESDVDVDFEFYDMKEADFHSVKTLLQNYIEIPGKDFLSSDFANLIAGQAAVGTTVKTEGCEEEPIGFITLLSLQFYASLPVVQQIKGFVLSHCPQESKAQMESLWNPKGPPLGLLVQARMMNLPFQLVSPLHNAVLEDLEWAVKNDESPELRASFQFQNFLLIAKAYPATGKKKGRTPQRFRYVEEEYYLKEATLSFRFPCASKDPPQEFVVMIVPKNRVAHALAAAASAIFEVPVHVPGRLRS